MKRLISEDQKMYDVQRQQMGMKNQYDPQANKVDSLVKQNNQFNNLAPVRKLYPLDLHDDILANMYIDMLNYKKMLLTGMESVALLKDKKLKTEYTAALKEVEQRVNVINNILVEINEIMDNISNGT